MENLPKSSSRQTPSNFSSPASSFMSSQSCDSIYHAKLIKQMPKLPIAQNTTKLLEGTQNESGKKEAKEKSNEK